MEKALANSPAVPIASPDVALDLVGGKGTSLAKLALAGLPVPSGLILTTTMYRDFVLANNMQPGIASALTDVAGTDTAALEAAAVKIQSLFAAARMPQDLSRFIRQAYADMGDDLAVAVRSSATAEDLPELSFAGQHDTYLNVCGQDALLEAVCDCWASLWSTRAIAYRQQKNIDPQTIAMAVIIQAMVQADVSGILFTANPATGDRSEIVINASFGLGESIVSGQVTPDTFVLDRASSEVKKSVPGTKEEMTVSNGHKGTSIQPVPDAKRQALSLDADRLADLASLSLKAEHLFAGTPQDIEWAISDGQCYLLQSRPITRLPVAPLTDVRWVPPYKGSKLIRRQVVENMPDPLSTLFEELYLQVGLEHSIDKLMEKFNAPFDIGDFIVRPMFVTVNGYAYCRADYRIKWRLILKMMVWYFKAIPAILRAIIPQWRDEDLPTYLAVIEQWKTVDVHSANDERLLAGVRVLTIADADYWFSVSMIMGMAKISDGALHMFLSVLVKGQLISGMFLRGFPSKTLEAQTELETIAGRIRAISRLRDLVIATPAGDLIVTLKGDAHGLSVAENIKQ